MSEESDALARISQQDSKNGQVLVIYLPEGSVIIDRMAVGVVAQPVDVISENISVDNIHGSHGHHARESHLDWLNIFNITFIAFIALVALVPTLLSTIFGVAFYASSSSNAQESIYSGDLMVSKLTPTSNLNLGDVLLLRNEYTWKLDVRRVTIASTRDAGDLTTIATESDKGSASSDAYVLNSKTLVHRVTSVIPKFGDVTIILTSIFAKIGVGVTLLIINVVVQVRRMRKRRAAW
jgi:hypothetical protein